MGKIILCLTMVVLVLYVKAQTYDEIKQTMMLGQYKKAKEVVDRRITNAKFAGKPEAYILKSAIYSSLAADESKLNTDVTALLNEAMLCFKKYREMDPNMSLVSDPIYKNAPIGIYSTLFNIGYKQYEAKNWAAGFETFQKVDEYSAILISQKLLNTPLDTNAVILAGITAESSNNKDEAAKYYGRLANHKLSGAGYESVYRFLVTYYFTKKDMANFEKYKDIGKELYPKSDFFTYDKTDFAVGLESSFDSKMKALEEVIMKDPGNYKANLSLGQLIYDTLNSKVEGAILPVHAPELEKKMVSAFKRAGEAQADEALPFLVIGDYFVMIQAEKIKKSDKKYGEYLEAGREPYEMAAAIFAKKMNLTGNDRQQYKKAAGFLEDIYNYKIEQTKKEKGKPADIAKYTAEAKKWGDLYSKIQTVTSSSNADADNGKNFGGNGKNSGIILMKEKYGGTYEVPCKLNGLEMVFIFDTGASDVSISMTEASFMLKNGYLKDYDIIDVEKYRIANGQLEEGFVINIRELKIGDYTLTNIRGSIVKSSKAPLLLGMAAIKKLGFKFDPSNGTLFK